MEHTFLQGYNQLSDPYGPPPHTTAPAMLRHDIDLMNGV